MEGGRREAEEVAEGRRREEGSISTIEESLAKGRPANIERLVIRGERYE